MSPTQRSLKKLRDDGYLTAVVERWNPYARIRQDLFGFIDIVAIKVNETLAVQTTSTSNLSSRLSKIAQNKSAIVWLGSTTRKIILHGWSKKGPRGKRKVWTCREIDFREYSSLNYITCKNCGSTSGNEMDVWDCPKCGASLSLEKSDRDIM